MRQRVRKRHSVVVSNEHGGLRDAPSASRRPWWKSADSPRRSLFLGCLMSGAALIGWFLLLTDARQWAFQLSLALFCSLLAARWLITAIADWSQLD